MSEALVVINNHVHKIVLLLPEDSIGLWKELCLRHAFRIPHRIVAGGPTRFHSVCNGLQAEPEADLVLVHDGVRPFPDDRLVAEVLRTAAEQGAAVPSLPVTDSLRILAGEGDRSGMPVDRSLYRSVQTPQGFCGGVLRRAYTAGYEDSYTDDASVVERNTDCRVVLTDGDPANLKITAPLDMQVAEILLESAGRNRG